MASVNKINYICSALNSVGVGVEIISCSMIANHHIDQTTEHIYADTSVTYLPADRISRSAIGKVIGMLKRNIILFFYLLVNAKKNETILVYHSLNNMRAVKFAQMIKRFKMCLEVEEIYNDVYKRSGASKRFELDYIKGADMYLFPSNILAQKFNCNKKPQAIVYGAYVNQRFNECKYDDGRIHIAYTGSFDPHKGGLMVALEIAKYLDDSFCLHVLGTGSDEVIETINSSIEYNLSKNLCEIKYDGLKNGDEYNRYLQWCDLGLSTQNPEATFNNTSFPSKVISYLANGLRVLTAPIDVLTHSEFGDILYYYRDNDPKKIADVIRSIDFSADYDSVGVIEELNRSFCESIRGLFKENDL